MDLVVILLSCFRYFLKLGILVSCCFKEMYIWYRECDVLVFWLMMLLVVMILLVDDVVKVVVLFRELRDVEELVIGKVDELESWFMCGGVLGIVMLVNLLIIFIVVVGLVFMWSRGVWVIISFLFVDCCVDLFVEVVIGVGVDVGFL